MTAVQQYWILCRMPAPFAHFPERMLEFLQCYDPKALLIRLLLTKRLDISNIDRLPAPKGRIALDFSNIDAKPNCYRVALAEMRI